MSNEAQILADVRETNLLLRSVLKELENQFKTVFPYWERAEARIKAAEADTNRAENEVEQLAAEVREETNRLLRSLLKEIENQFKVASPYWERAEARAKVWAEPGPNPAEAETHRLLGCILEELEKQRENFDRSSSHATTMLASIRRSIDAESGSG